MTTIARPALIDLAPEGLTIRERELYLARGIASGDIELDCGSLKDLVINLLATVEESARINVGIIGENTNLRRKLDGTNTHDEGVIPGLELAQMLINKALRDA